MSSKTMTLAVALTLILGMWVYFLINPSYDKSVRAKYYYEIGEYKEALSLAKEAFSIDIYNRMAATIMAQSITSMKYVNYLNDAKKYMKTINEIATHDVILDADKARMRLMCNVMISSYIKLAPSVITAKELISEAAKYNDGFEKLLEKISR
jgi:tetratricopeptide (TPR) repeat protein